MANKILHTTIMQKNTTGGKNIIYPKTVTKNIIDGSGTLDQTLDALKLPDISDKIVTFTQADTRQNLVSGETLATSQGKIMKLISDLKSLAYSDTVGVSNLDSNLTTAYNNRVTMDNVTTSTSITSAGYVADARVVNNLQTQINTVNKNIAYEEINISNCSTLEEVVNIMKNNKLKTGIGSVGNLQESNLKSLLGNPNGFGNYTIVEAKFISERTIHLYAITLAVTPPKQVEGFIEYNNVQWSWSGWKSYVTNSDLTENLETSLGTVHPLKFLGTLSPSSVDNPTNGKDGIYTYVISSSWHMGIGYKNGNYGGQLEFGHNIGVRYRQLVNTVWSEYKTIVPRF